MECEREQLATSSHSMPVKMKCELVVKEEPEWGECGASEAAAEADLYEDHEIKEDLAFGPELLQKQDITRSVHIFSMDLEPLPNVKMEQQAKTNEESSDHRSEGGYDSDVPLRNSDMLIKDKFPFKLEPPNEVKREPECIYVSPGEPPGSMSLEQQFKLRSCFVRLERIPLLNTQPVHISVSCNFCGKKFTRKSDFTRHIRIHTGEKPYTCEVCRKQFTDRTNLTRHFRIHTEEKPHTCDVCRKQFTARSGLTRHVRRLHEKEVQQKHCCNVCQKIFIQKSDFNKHIISHMGKEPRACIICDKQFAKQSDLARHIRVHTGEKPYSCDICTKQFADSSVLTRHKRVHSGVKSYSCNTCHKRFGHNSHLNRHVLIHTSVKQFICDVCNNRFTNKRTLSVHLRMHMGKTYRETKSSGFHKDMPQADDTTCPYTDNESSLSEIALVKKGNFKIK